MADFVEPDVYVDGACRNNGQQNPQGGCGVYWGEYHPLNTSEYLIGDKQTNRAELSAAIIALEQAKQIKISTLNINTDSKYVKEGITTWITSWKHNGWKTKQKTDVLNKDLWQTIDRLCNQMNVNWRWVEGHSDVTGNIIADEFAKEGISSECCYWQTVENDTETEVFIEMKTVSETRRSGVPQTKEARSREKRAEKTCQEQNQRADRSLGPLRNFVVVVDRETQFSAEKRNFATQTDNNTRMSWTNVFKQTK